ncbi:hypothetical protein EPI10_022048 [Gossypium australe]|uniref:Uncharacterized protein n=1 Tax=Gossypium australe TaxID=47621 RepID=A0A5B6WKK4_9ROSI|nr:hypothetical protein EPI10_022048 [Gossypium australe]
MISSQYSCLVARHSIINTTKLLQCSYGRKGSSSYGYYDGLCGRRNCIFYLPLLLWDHEHPCNICTPPTKQSFNFIANYKRRVT